MTSAKSIAERLGGKRGRPVSGRESWTCRCPAHEDHSPSLTVSSGADGRVLLHCHAGCSFAAIVAALSVEPTELFPDERKSERKGLGDPVARYDYADEAGELLYQVLRYEPEGEAKTFRQRRPDGDGWAWGVGDRRVLYRLPDVLETDPSKPVYLVEGEKDVERLEYEGLVATTSGGAKSWRTEYAKSLAGRDVIILPDNDDPGRGYAKDARRDLERVARSVRVVELVGLEEGGDVSDWLATHSRDDLLAASAPVDVGLVAAAERIAAIPGFQEQVRERVVPWGIRFLDDRLGCLYANDLVVIAADTGAGKTTIGVQVAMSSAAHGRRVAHFALEAHDGEMEQRMVYTEVSRLAWSREMSGREMLTFGRWINGMAEPGIYALNREAMNRARVNLGSLYTRYRGDRFTAADIRREFSQLDVDLVIFDHVHYVDSDDDNENRALKEVAQTLRYSALELGRPVVAIAHVRKRGLVSGRLPLLPRTADIHGSSELTKNATRVVVLAPGRGRETPRDPDTGERQRHLIPTYMRVEKCRWDGEDQLAAVLLFDIRHRSYEDRYLLGRMSPTGTEFEELTIDEVPDWCSCVDLHQQPTILDKYTS